MMNQRNIRKLSAVVGVGALAVFVAGCETVSHDGGEYGHGGNEPVIVVSEPQVFSADEAATLREYHAGHRGKSAKPLPPGLRKKAARGKALPPGWQRKLARGEVLDVAVYERGRPLPDEIAIRLPNEHGTTVTIILEGKAVRLIRATREIIDVLDL